MFEALSRSLRAFAEKDGRGYPDWAVRYVPIVKGLKRRRLDPERILEIGANENGLGRFAGLRPVALDVAVEHLEAARAGYGAVPVVGDAAALPFRDGAFDLCACIDTLEHLNEATRKRAVDEIARVIGSTGTAVVAFPSGIAAERAEKTVRQRYRQYTGRFLTWLEEHLAEGLPEADAVTALIETRMAETHRVTRMKNGSLWIWVWMWMVLLCGWPGRANAFFQAGLRVLTPLLCRIHAGTCYRAVIWMDPKAHG